MSPRLVMVVLDAAEPLLLEEGMRDGWLPELAGFFAAGTSVRLRPVDEAFPGSNWPTFNTGVTLSAHHVLRDRRLAPRSYRIEDVPAAATAEPPFWRHVSDAGLRTTVVNTYGAPLLDAFNGTQLQGWATMDPYTSKFGRPLVDPPETAGWLEREAGRPALAYEVHTPRSHDEVRRYRDDRLADIATRTRAHRLLLERGDWDLFLVSYPELHQAGHLLWHVHDPEHPEHDPAAPQDVRESLRDLYRGVDEAVGILAASRPEGCPMFLLSPHGMGVNHLVGDPADEVLHRLGWFALAGDGAARASARERLVRAGWRAARRVVPEDLRLALRRRVADRPWVESMALADVDWAATKAFTVPPDSGSYIRLNVRGREPSGTIEPGADYDRAIRELTEIFRELDVEPDGAPAVERVLGPDELAGPEAPNGMPDLLVLWTRRTRIERLRSPRLGTIDLPHTDPRTGQHRPLGFMAGVAPSLAGGGSADVGPEEGTLLDVAPTALTLLGVPVPPSLPGRPVARFLAR